jgi:hypothetical protein
MTKGDDQVWHANRTSQGENAGMHITMLSWQHVFNGDKGFWGQQQACAEAADAAGYTYYSWSDRIYRTGLRGPADTGLTVRDVS